MTWLWFLFGGKSESMEPLIGEAVMGAARSVDLRERVVAEVSSGTSRRQAAIRFKVSASSAIRDGAGAGDGRGGSPAAGRPEPLAAGAHQAAWSGILENSITTFSSLSLNAIGRRVKAITRLIPNPELADSRGDFALG